MATPRKPVRKTPSPAPRSVPSEAPPNDATAMNVELLRNMINASITASQGLMKQLGRMQQTNAQAMQELSADLDKAVAEAGRARSVEALLSLQAELASSQMARMAQHYGSMMTQWMDAEVAFVEHAQDDATKLSRQVLGAKAVTAPATVAWSAAEPTPLALLDSAQNALTEMTGQWIEAVRNVAARAQLPLV